MKNLFTVLLIFLATMTYGQIVYEMGDISSDTVQIEEVNVTGSYTAVRGTPFTFQNLNSSDISFRTNGEESAVLFSNTPSVNYYSDNGTGLGYIYYRIRGIDQTRINTTLNGIPLNEPEDQGIYFNNYVNFLNSISSIQLIRGAGLSKPGVSSYGGSINFNSLTFSEEFSGFSKFSLGSYGTMQLSGGVNTPNFFINGSYSTTSGYKYNSFNDSWSTFYGANWKDFKWYGFVGKQKNGMGWLGEPLDSIYSDPRYNSNTSDETDDFTQVHNQIEWEKYGLSIKAYHTYLNGWYDMDMAHFDSYHPYGDLIYRLNLQSNWFGTLINYNIRAKDWLNLNGGISAYTYYRDHHGTYNKYSESEPWYYEYENTGHRNELSPYVKGEFKIGSWSVYGDVQYRWTNFKYDGFAEFDPLYWNFLNWSAGTSLRFSKSQIYYGVGRTNREPTRTDLFSGWDDYDPDAYNPVKPETALSNELGYRYLGECLILNTNIYYMDFQNEIVLNGQVGPNAIVLHQNAAKSFRSGLEIDGVYKFYNGFELRLVSSFSYNRIAQDGEKLHPVLSSPVIVSVDALYRPHTALYVGFNTRYNSKSYIDFANEHELPNYTLMNVYAGVNWKKFEVKGMLNNIGNQLVLGNAIISGPDPSYFVMAGINGSVSLTYKF
jgi:iron complex outermembrane recepter protein